MEQDAATSDFCRSETFILYGDPSPHEQSSLTSLALDLSLEFLMGRALDNAMLNVGMKDVARGEDTYNVESHAY